MAQEREPLRVGIIGADTKASWAKESHVPALAALSDIRLAAVATRHAESARAAAEAFGAERWFDDPAALIRSDAVDIVTVAIRVPAHHDLVMAALQAGKAVYCESPLGRNRAEAEEMASAARAAGAHVAIGLQARWNPSLLRAASLVSSGAIGEPLTARIVSTSAGFGPASPSAYDYFNKAEAGADLSTITLAHTLDAMQAVIGHVAEVVARAAILFPTVQLTDTGETSTRETPDQLTVLGKTRRGCEFVVDVNGGIAPDQARFDFEIRGSEGWVKLTGGFPFGFQAADLTLTSSAYFAKPAAPLVGTGAPPPAINVGELYSRFAADIRAGAHDVPGFDHAVRMTSLVDLINEAARSGARRSVADGKDAA